MAWEEMKAKMTNATTQDMATIFKTSNQTVATAGVVGLQLDYCFNFQAVRIRHQKIYNNTVLLGEILSLCIYIIDKNSEKKN